MTGSDSSHPKGPKLDSEISLRAIVIFVVVLVLIVVATSAGMYFLSVGLRDRGIAQEPPVPVLPEARARHEPPAPRLQSDPMLEMAELSAEETAELTSYGWVDEAGGVASVPVDRAMDLLVERAGSITVESAGTEDEDQEGGH